MSVVTGVVSQKHILLLGKKELLDFSSNLGIHGTVPPEIGDASSLYQLDFSECNIAGTIPSQLRNLNRIGKF
jgi:hypothetical protein